jgi:CheY-like chemotaxis protein
MGLGLAICHTVMLKHGGAIDVRSEIGAGTTFHLHFPASRRLRGEQPATGQVIRPQKGSILVMDDDKALRRVLHATLQRLGHQVEVVADGGQAIEAYRRAHNLGHPFDLVILDLTVRDGLGGQETILELRKIEPAVKAIVMTGYSNDPAVVEPTRHGFQGVLTKPFDGDKLEDLVSCLLAGGADS